MKPFTLASTLLALTVSTPVFAALGGVPVLPPLNAPSTGVNLMAAVPVARVVASTAAFSVRRATLPNGTVAREYLNPAGEVFAIGWNGPFQPDLRTLMGDVFFARYAQAIQAAHAAGVSMRGQMALSTPDLVVQSHGHVRAFTGLAYVPSLLPAGVTPQQLL